MGSSESIFVMYADDATIYYKSEDFDHEKVSNEINSEPENSDNDNDNEFFI